MALREKNGRFSKTSKLEKSQTLNTVRRARWGKLTFEEALELLEGDDGDEQPDEEPSR